MVHGAFGGEMILCIVLGFILSSLRRFWILGLKGLMAFALFLNKFSYFINMMKL